MKEVALQIINELPDTVDMADIIEALYIRAKITKGFQDLTNDDVVLHEELKKEIESWWSNGQNLQNKI